MKENKVRVLHLIVGLSLGGAEAMLYKLLKHPGNSNVEPVVVSLTDLGYYGKKIRDLGIPVYCLNMSKVTLPILKLRKIVKVNDTQVIQAWMYHANLFALICKPFLINSPKILWNIRSGLSNIKNKTPLTQYLIRISARLSKFPNVIVNNSGKSQHHHHKIGYSPKRDFLIPNGFDLIKYKPSPELYDSFRLEHRLEKSTKIIAMIARYHPVKNHPLFIKVASFLKHKNVKFILGGEGCDSTNHELVNMIHESALSTNILLLGVVDSAEILPAADVYLSCSKEEGFPNIIGEAMCCGVSCAATNVGECQSLLDSYGVIADIDDAEALADGCLQLLETDNRSTMIKHMSDNYSIQSVSDRYTNLYRSLIPGELCAEL